MTREERIESWNQPSDHDLERSPSGFVHALLEQTARQGNDRPIGRGDCGYRLVA